MTGSSNDNSTANSGIGSAEPPVPPLTLVKPKSQVITIPLDEENFLLWKFQIETALKGYDLQDYVNGTKAMPPGFGRGNNQGQRGNANQRGRGRGRSSNAPRIKCQICDKPISCAM